MLNQWIWHWTALNITDIKNIYNYYTFLINQHRVPHRRVRCPPAVEAFPRRRVDCPRRQGPLLGPPYPSPLQCTIHMNILHSTMLRYVLFCLDYKRRGTCIIHLFDAFMINQFHSSFRMCRNNNGCINYHKNYDFWSLSNRSFYDSRECIDFSQKKT